MSIPDGEYVIWVNTPSAWLKADDFNWENGGGVGITITSKKLQRVATQQRMREMLSLNYQDVDLAQTLSQNIHVLMGLE